MRKTCPINIPETQQSLSPCAYPLTLRCGDDTSTSNDNIDQSRRSSLDCFFEYNNDKLPLVQCIESTDTTTVPLSFENNDDFYELENSSNDQNVINASANEITSTRQLENEFLNVLTTQHLMTEHDDLNLSAFVSTTNTDDCTSTRPARQMGRRAEGRARVVSITAETNSSGNQVSTRTY